MESWQIFNYAKKVLPINTIRLTFTRATKCVECWGGATRDGIDSRWAADPTYCSATERNPIDRVKILLTELDRYGYGHVSRAAVDILAEPLGGHFELNKNINNDKDVAGEAADAMEALGSLIGIIRESLADGELNKNEKGEVLEQVRRLKSEVDQLYSAACESSQGK